MDCSPLITIYCYSFVTSDFGGFVSGEFAILNRVGLSHGEEYLVTSKLNLNATIQFGTGTNTHWVMRHGKNCFLFVDAYCNTVKLRKKMEREFAITQPPRFSISLFVVLIVCSYCIISL